jgi:hypothetical protein
MCHIDDLIALLNELKTIDFPKDIKILIYASVNDYRLKLEELIANVDLAENCSKETQKYIADKREELDEHYKMVKALLPAMMYYLVQKKN